MLLMVLLKTWDDHDPFFNLTRSLTIAAATETKTIILTKKTIGFLMPPCVNREKNMISGQRLCAKQGGCFLIV